MKNSKGFTLIELVVVIVILGILAAVALPRFMDASRDAHRSALEGAAGGLASAVTLVRSQQEVNRSGGVQGCGGSNCFINVRGFGAGTVDVNANFWPAGTGLTGNPPAVATPSVTDCQDLWVALLQGSAPTVTGANSDYVVTAAPANSCTYTYQRDNADDTIVYNTSTGVVTHEFN